MQFLSSMIYRLDHSAYLIQYGFSVPEKCVFILATSADTDEMPHFTGCQRIPLYGFPVESIEMVSNCIARCIFE